MQHTVRRAVAGEHDAVSTCIGAAYARHIDRIGKKPAPMLADYQQLIASGAVHVVDGLSGVSGVVVMMPDERGMFLENTNEAMAENLTFYAKLGFQQIDRRLEDGCRRIYFCKLLA